MQNGAKIKQLAEEIVKSKAKLIDLILEDTETSYYNKLLLLEEHSGWKTERYIPHSLYQDLNQQLKEIGKECGYTLEIDRYPEDRRTITLWTEDTEDVDYNPEYHPSDLMAIVYVGNHWDAEFEVWMERSAYMELIYDYAVKHKCIGYACDW